jgi:hypothetical protein
MRGRYLHRSQGFGIKPAVAVTQARATGHIPISVDGGNLDCAIERRAGDLAPVVAQQARQERLYPSHGSNPLF